ncbi:hypothetical protein [Sodalis sp. C49]|uniref:hypothetical protein n=1 Tax=unclassified Sodalis (in: enterobacteria) TaxID=2636512 RepID=UPI003965BDA9
MMPVSDPTMPTTTTHCPLEEISQGDNGFGQGVTRFARSFSGAANSALPFIKTLSVVTLSAASAIGIVFGAQRLIAVSIQNISKPPPVTHLDVREWKGKIMGLGLSIGMLGGGAAGFAAGCALESCKSFCGADPLRHRDSVFYTVGIGFIVGALAGVAYTNFIDIELDNITQ